MIQVYTRVSSGNKWLQQYQGCSPTFACVLGFTATGLIPGISAAGATPQDREYTAVADAEFLYCGARSHPKHPLPILKAGASPAFISRAIVQSLAIPVHLFNAGLPHPLTVPNIDLGGLPAQCLTSGQALPYSTVRYLFEQGLQWGEKLAKTQEYLIIGECVVGGTTTALAILTGLGIKAVGKVNSSHPQCNHTQKWSVVTAGLQQAELLSWSRIERVDPMRLVAAVGDPMQIVVAGMAIAASKTTGVMLAGGTQMLAVYALIQAIVNYFSLPAQLEQIVVGTTSWVAEDSTGDTVGLAELIDGVSLLASKLNFSTSSYSSFCSYERGYVKEGVGAGGCAIAAYLKQEWTPTQLLMAVETLFSRYCHLRFNSAS